MKVLRQGSRGSEVRRLQQLLNIGADGIFGAGTKRSVIAFQKSKGLSADGIVGKGTWGALEKDSGEPINPDPEPRTADWLVAQYQAKGYILHTGGRVNFGSLRTIPGTPNRFDDFVFMLWQEGGVWKVTFFEATTDPGTYWLENPGNSRGTAILCPGQYVDVYKIDKHGGKYEALCQRNGKVKVWRDKDRDAVAEYQQGSEGEDGWYGINIHRASSSRMSTNVEKWSAGCQVMADPDDFARFMTTCHSEKKLHGETFTWTLLENHVS